MNNKKTFLVIIYGTGEEVASLPKAEQDEHMSKWWQWDSELKTKSYKLHGEAIQPTGMVISGKEKKVTEGVYPADKKYVIGGYYVLQALNMEEAVEIVKSGCPSFELDGVVEVREIMTFNS